MELTSTAHPTVTYEVLRVPFLLEFGYSEGEAFCESYSGRMKRKFNNDKEFNAFNGG